MAERAPQNMLRRKLEAGCRAAPPASRRLQPAKVLSSALIKAADAASGLEVSVRSSSERIASLPDLLECLPENGLLALLEGPGDGQGVMALDISALSAVIEKQMTGSVARKAPQSRRVTRTDAALAADLVDATLQRFETALSGLEESRWASGFGYSSHIEDLRPLGLLLEEVDYRIFGMTLVIEGGAREGEILLALPAQGRGQMVPPKAAPEGEKAGEDATWAPRLEGQVLQGEVRLEAVLHQFRMPISTIKALKPGQEIPIPVAALDDVRLAGAEDLPLGRCRLGRCQGHRALRLGGGHASGQGREIPHVDEGNDFSPAAPCLSGTPQPRSVDGGTQFQEATDTLPAPDPVAGMPDAITVEAPEAAGREAGSGLSGEA